MTEQQLHPLLGISRPDGEYPHRCSKCDVEIPEEGRVPLMLWDDRNDNLMWVVCEDCSMKLLPKLLHGGAAIVPRKE